MGFFSLIFSLVSLLLTMIAFIPLLGWLNWIFVPISIISLILNSITYNINLGFRKLAKIGLTISVVSVVIGILRLHLFGGIL